MFGDEFLCTCGTDIIEIERIKKAIEDNEKFVEKVYSKSEIIDVEKITSDFKYERYAGKFAAKEAIYKAISKILDEKNLKTTFLDFEILNDNIGRPYFNVKNKEIENVLKEYDYDLSISHIKSCATATCIIFKK